MELKLGLALPNPGHCKAFRSEPCALLDGKRWFGVGEAVGATGGKLQAARPLSVRGGGETTDKRKRRLVGWPPVKCARLRGGACSGYVKVKKMEGVAIGRKVDVSLHGSYDELRRTLDHMFPPSPANQGGRPAGADAEEDEAAVRGPRVVAYEDGEGD